MGSTAARVMTGGAQAFWLGANFWSRTGGPLMWRSYDPAVIRAELAVLQRPRADHDPVVLLLARLHARPSEIDETLSARFADFLDRHAEQGMPPSRPSSSATCPARTGTRPGAAAATSTRTCGWSAARPGSPAEMTRRFAGHPAVAGWLVSNEMPIYGGSATDHETVAGLGADHQGRGPRGRRPPALLDRRRRLGRRGHRRGQRLPARRHRRIVDFLGPHVYPVETTRPPAATRPPSPASWRARSAAGDPGGVRRQLGLRLRR